MREQETAAGERKHDLATMEMPGEDQVERVAGKLPHNPREVAEENPEVGFRVRELPWSRGASRR